MKKLILVILIFLTGFFGFAQKHNIYYGFGRTFFGTFDIKGINLVTGYEYLPKKWLGWKSQLNFASGSYVDNYPENYLYKPYTYDYDTYSNQALKIQTGLSFKVINLKRHIVNIDVLSVLSKYKILANSGIIINPDKNAPIEWSYFRMPPQYDFGTSFGGMGQAGYFFLINNKFSLGIEYNLQIYNGNGERNLNLILRNSF